MRLDLRGVVPAAATLFILLGSGGCGNNGANGDGDVGAPDAGADADAAVDEDAGPKPPAFCEGLSLPERPFSEGPYGTLRHDLAADFTVPLVGDGGGEWSLREGWTGCESYVFVPDILPRSELDRSSIWESDVDYLIEDSPPNAHFFFVSGEVEDNPARFTTEAMVERIDEALAVLSEEDAAHWRERLHVVAGRGNALEGWIPEVLAGHGRRGFAIDRFQRIRDVGSFADVNRFSSALQDAGHWPWSANLSYAQYEARYFNYEAERQERIDAAETVEITPWTGEILSEFAEADITLPSAAEMAEFDTFEIDVTANCPDAEAYEFGNCGAWDYIANLFVYDGEERVELARFITTYHREGRYVVDATPMLVHLRDGGPRRIRWSFAPPWNTQPTATWLTLRFSNRGRGIKPTELTRLWSGGGFGSGYNIGREPMEVVVPADATRVEVWGIVTGHGGATNNCAEFCNHQHEFTVNGHAYVKEHPTVGNNQGCLDEIGNGVVPNQGGTWWFGRGGWCPGQQVDPFVFDVTGDVKAGQTATVSYRGLFRDGEPPDGSGDIVLTSYLVVYR